MFTRSSILLIVLVGCLVVGGFTFMQQQTQPGSSSSAMTKASPADGHTIHVLAPHVVEGKVMGPFHHYCKIISPEPVIECLIYESTDPGAPMTEVEYIVAKSITRPMIPLADWNKNWHDHLVEIQTGRVQVLDVPPAKAKEIADLVSTTDGLIFHLWPHVSRTPTSEVTITQSVGHVPSRQTQ